MPLKQISLFLPNKPGQLANFFEFLMNHKIYIRSLTVAETEDYGLLLLLVKPFDKCIALLEDNDYLHSVTEVIAVKLSDNITQLYNIAKTLGNHDVNIEYMYTFAEKTSEISTMTVLRLDDNEKGISVLKEHGFEVVEDFK
ncbi:MAG: amino acid-binding protein [Candidatus Lokiarchaeota archaeon]|nr:amino acid-binding protein [Candidatus Lokiarchaeota archaeon]